MTMCVIYLFIYLLYSIGIFALVTIEILAL